MSGGEVQNRQNAWRQLPYRGPQRVRAAPQFPPPRPQELPPCRQEAPPERVSFPPQHRPCPPQRLQRLERGDLLMLAILYLLLSEDGDDAMLPLLAIGLYLVLK